MPESRVKNTKRNIVSGLFSQIINIIIPFIINTLILYILGERYLGFNSLIMSILQTLNLADLGFSQAVVYILYRPIADNDIDTVCSIMAYFKKVYRVIGMVVLVLGILILPFLPRLIKSDCPSDLNIHIPYLIYLTNSVISYWFYAYKSALLTAMQRMDVVNNITTMTRVFMELIQIIILLFVKNYYLFLIFLPIFTIINNILIGHSSEKLFPKIMPYGIIPHDIKNNLIKQVKGIFIDRIGDASRNGADSIFLSALIGLTTVAVYNNYYTIYAAVYNISLIIANSLKASVGNSIVMETVDKNYSDLCKFTFIYSLFSGWCTTCLCCLYQPFVFIWMRGNTNLMLTNYNMYIFCVYFYSITMNNIRNQYLDGCGIYWELRLWYILEAVGNIVLNLLLGYLFGVTGILIATLITIVIFNFIARTNVMFKVYFKRSPKEYYMQHIKYILATLVNVVLAYWVCSLIPLGGIFGLGVRLIVCTLLSSIIYVCIYHKTKMFNESLSWVMSILKRS